MSAGTREGDAAARRAARTVFDRPLVLVAGAGTGKTAALVSRVVSWCTGPGWERTEGRLRSGSRARGGPSPEEIAAECLARVTAITFTEKAAAEMAERCAEAFERLARGEEVTGLPTGELAVGGDALRRRATALATRIDRLPVTTIHGFCARLLQAWPLEAGLRPGFSIDADGRRTREVAEAVVAARVGVEAGEEVEDLATLAAAGIGARELADVLAALLARRVGPGELAADPLPPARQEEIARRVARDAADLLGELANLEWGGAVARRLEDAFRALADLGGEGSLDAVRARLSGRPGDQLRADLRRAVDPAKKPVTLLAAEDVAGFRARWSAFRLLVEEVAGLDPALLGALHRVLRRWLADAERELHAAGIVGFDGLLVEAHRLLASRPAVLRAERAALDQLLVDEVQDTDPLQYEIVALLGLAEEPGPRPGLFIVGDPKQSIYGFRSADLEAWEGFRHRVEESGGEVHSLVVNFRSDPPVLDEVRRVVAPLMVRERGVQPPWEDLVPARGPETVRPLPGERRPVEYWVSWEMPRNSPGDTDNEEEDEGKTGPRTPATRARELEAAAIARDLRRRMAEDPGFRLGGVAILLRATTAQAAYLAALRSHGIPCVVERERDWTRRRDVIELAAVVRAVVDPLDQVALLAALRAPFAAVPDAALPPLWREGFAGLAVRLGDDSRVLESAAGLLREVAGRLRERAAEVPGLERIEGWEEAAIHFLAVLAELRRSFRTDRVDVFVRRLADRLLPAAEASARWLGEHRVARQRAFLRRLLERLRGLGGSPHEVLRALRETTAGLVEFEAPAAADPGIDAVHVLTIHKAKGLTFDEVYVPDLHHGATGDGKEDGPRVVRDGNRVLAGIGGLALPGDADRRALRERKGLAEAIRTFYVAITRPRHRLVLCGRWPAPDRSGANSIVERLAAVRGNPLAAMLPEQEEERVDRHGVRWRILGAGEAPEVPGGGTEPGSGGTDPTPLLAAAAARREKAAARREVACIRSPSGTAEDAENEAPGSGEFSGDPVPGPRERDVLLAAGTVVHRLLERFVPGEDPATAWESLLRERLPALVEAAAPPGLEDAVKGEVREILAGFPGTEPFRRLVRVFPGILGREVPVVLAADPAAEGCFAWSGTIDLLYRDPDTGEVVVADHKTDRAPGAGERERLLARYGPQLAVYARGVARALGLGRTPRRELWLLREGVILPMV